MTLCGKISGIFIFLTVCLFNSACDKQIHFSGVVLSRHMVPMPSITVSVAVGYGEHTYGGHDVLVGNTDQNGKFKINAKVCNSCWGSEIGVQTVDSGSVEHQEIPDASDIIVILK